MSLTMESHRFDVESQSLLASRDSVQAPGEDDPAGIGVEVHVSGLHYSVKRSGGSRGLGCCGSSRQKGYSVVDGSNEADRPILRNVSLHLKPGGMLAVLGNSGSGKTSLLDCIGQRTAWGSKTTGTVFLDGRPATAGLFRSCAAYVMQDDTLLPYLTVRESLSYVLRLTLACSREEHDRRVNLVIQELGLKAVENTVVGGTDTRGISGGERRRVSIAVQLLAEPGLILLDEPTSGLDSHTAHHLAVMLAQLAATRRHTIILSIHQPRSDMFEVFDQVMILSRGETAYCGPARSMVEYFTTLGHPCEAYTNPLDEYVDVCSIDTRRDDTIMLSAQKVKELTEAYQKSEFAQQVFQARPEPDGVSTSSRDVYVDNSPNWLLKLFILASRMNMNLLRARTGMQMRVFQMLLFGIVLFIFILRIKDDQRSVQDRSGVFYQVVSGPLFIGMLTAVAQFPSLRNCMGREVRDGLYYTPTFMLGYLVHILPFCVFSSLLMASAFYWAVGFVNNAMAFVAFCGVTIAIQFVGEASGLFCLAIFDDPNIANSVAALYFSLTAMLSAGFLRNIDSMPKVLQYFTYIGVQKYASEILVAHEYPNLKLSCGNNTSTDFCRYPTGDDYLKAVFPDAVADLNRNYYCMTGFCAGIFVVAMMIFSLRSYIKRR